MPPIKKRLQSQSFQKHALDVIDSLTAYSGNEAGNMAND